MDADLLVLCLFLATTIVGFTWRRTRLQLLYGLWLVAIWIEQQARKWRDGKGGTRGGTRGI
jgi:hypothetical protein